ncbi:MAG: flagellar biosynthesis protein FlhB [Vulcanimicrobiaceae bacterium]
MAKPEQTEQATPKRRSEARKRGQVARSPDLAGAVIFLAAVIVLHSMAPTMLGGIATAMHVAIGNAAQQDAWNVTAVWMLFVEALAHMGLVLVVVLGIAFIVGIMANLLQFGFLFTLKPLVPSFSKVNPFSGFQRLFSRQTAFNLLKQVLKLGAVAILLYATLSSHLDQLVRTGQSSTVDVVGVTGSIIFDLGWKFGVFLVIVGLLDYWFNRRQLENSLKMTKQEVKDEFRQSEGSPEAKGAVRRRQREFARRRMMAAVPRATVVVTNPTHFAVALEWDEVTMDAPVVTAKGADLVAKRIRALAVEHGVPIMENPPLARAIYDNVEIDHPVPPTLYAAVAQVIAFVYRLKRRTIA